MSFAKPSFLDEINPEASPDSPALLAIHGLNQNPSALIPLLKDIGHRTGTKVYLLHLPGHRSRTQSYEMLQVKDFDEDLASAYHFIHQAHQGPPCFLGYSMGALLALSQWDQLPMSNYVLLAPALSLRWYAPLLQIFLPVLPRVPSKPLGTKELEEHYRFHQAGVPREVYKCFFSIYKRWQKSGERLPPKQGLILVHPSDELVAPSRLQSLTRQQAHNWKLRLLNNSQAPYNHFNHLCFDKTTLGSIAYEELLHQVSELYQV